MVDEADDGGDPELSRLRRAIDAVDDELLAALNRRAELAREVGAWKAAHARPFWAPERERAVVERLARANPGPFPQDGIAPVFAEIISACLALERRLRVAYLGPEATFTHQAARARFGLGARYAAAGTIAAVLGEVARGAADVGVVPTESAAEGVLSHALDLLSDGDLTIAQEIVIEAAWCLLAQGGALDGIDKVYGHPLALAACRGWLAANAPAAAAIPVEHTAQAARLAAEDARAAALAPSLGELYGLKLAARAVADAPPAPARFLAVAPPDRAPPPSGRDKTTLLIAVADAPGGLGRALAPFAASGINLSRIESRPPRRAPTGGKTARRAWERGYAFVDLAGHAADAEVARLLGRLRDEGILVRVLGSYPCAPETAA